MKPCVIVLIVFLSCSLPAPLALGAETQTAATALAAWLAPISQADDSDTAGTPPPSLRMVARFYREVSFRPVWTHPGGLLPRGRRLLQAMAGAVAAERLSAAPYRFNEGEVINAAATDGDLCQLCARQIRQEVWITARILHDARQMLAGRVEPDTTTDEWLARRRIVDRDLAAELAAAVASGAIEAFVASLHPDGQAFLALRAALRRYTAIQQAGGWPAIPPGDTLRQGDAGSRVASLIHRLTVTGDLTVPSPAADPGIRYSRSVETAVRRFQRRHGLTPDGVAGGRTLAALNVPAEARINQLQLNLERLRWFPDTFGDRYLVVNIPAFELRLVEDGATSIRMRAIVGKNRRQTPVMSGRMTYLELNPYWNIPAKIARRDILPKVLADPDYLSRQGIHIFDGWDPQAAELDPGQIAWQAISPAHFPYRLRQDPSTRNALGRVKFMFPNRHSIYIHDTPSRGLFDRTRRNFSSGCVRVESPLRLADLLLQAQNWKPKRLEEVVESGERRVVVLNDPLPVHLVYFTAWAGDGGEVHFRDDVYGRDRRLAATLAAAEKRPFRFDAAPDAGQLLLAQNPSVAPDTGSKKFPNDRGKGLSAQVAESTGKVTGHPVTGI